MKPIEMPRFPWWLPEEDHLAMELLCAAELDVWRRSVRYHQSLPTVNMKLKNRNHLEQAFDMLQLAWARVNESVEAAAAA